MRLRSHPLFVLPAVVAFLFMSSSGAIARDLAAGTPPIVALPGFVASMSGHNVTVSNDFHGRCRDAYNPTAKVEVPAVGYVVEVPADHDDGLWEATLPASTWPPGIYTVEATCTDNRPVPSTFAYASTTVEVTAAGPEDDPAPPSGYRWAAFHAFLDASPAFLTSLGCPTDAVFPFYSGTCEGEFRTPTTTWPFNEDRHGTLKWEQYNGGEEERMTLYVVGAYLGGTIHFDAANRTSFRVRGGTAPWGSTIHTPNLPWAPRGTKGGPLGVDATRVSTHDGYYFDIRGWLLVPKTPAVVESGDPGVVGTTPAVVESGNPGVVGTTPAVATPRFTG